MSSQIRYYEKIQKIILFLMFHSNVKMNLNLL